MKELQTKFKASLKRIYLQLGSHFLRKGASLLPGQQVNLPSAIRKGFKGSKIKRGAHSVYVDNVYYNFKQNKVNYRFSEKKPIVGSANEASR